jgi:hypothetical protein
VGRKKAGALGLRPELLVIDRKTDQGLLCKVAIRDRSVAAESPMNAGDGHGRALEHVPVAIGRTEYRYVGRTVAVIIGSGSNVRTKSPSNNTGVAIERERDPPLTVQFPPTSEYF